MPAAESMCMMPGAVDAQSMMHPHIHIRLHEQRRRGLAAALGLPEAALGQTISVHQLIAADAPYKLLVVHRPADGKEKNVQAFRSNDYSNQRTSAYIWNQVLLD